ncbi:MAG TPA: ferrochelatase [Stellaceae bacterium]|jgi:ferrochelatase|nr:ferrochelatase [Stellaceae bacterium]
MRTAIVLMNLGGPDRLSAVRPFLYNLFADPAIIRLPAWLRLPLAQVVAWRRAETAREIYAQLDGGSPLLVNTEAQAQALEQALGPSWRCFIAMRYWHPLTPEAVAAVKAWQPEKIVLLPLYPQYSTTTTASSLATWHREVGRQDLRVVTTEIRSYPQAPGFIAAQATLISATLAREAGQAGADCPMRFLFSAHGLPLKIVEAGDPYPTEIQQTADALAAAVMSRSFDWVVCYQSRVGPLAWLGPSVDQELRRAARDRVGVVVVPVSFVSEHSETLVELDRDYRRLAERYGVPFYWRVPTVGTEPAFIEALAGLVRAAAGSAT